MALHIFVRYVNLPDLARVAAVVGTSVMHCWCGEPYSEDELRPSQSLLTDFFVVTRLSRCSGPARPPVTRRHRPAGRERGLSVSVRPSVRAGQDITAAEKVAGHWFPAAKDSAVLRCPTGRPHEYCGTLLLIYPVCPPDWPVLVSCSGRSEAAPREPSRRGQRKVCAPPYCVVKVSSPGAQ